MGVKVIKIPVVISLVKVIKVHVSVISAKFNRISSFRNCTGKISWNQGMWVKKMYSYWKCARMYT